MFAKLLSQYIGNSICWHESQFLLPYLEKFDIQSHYKPSELYQFLRSQPRFNIWPVNFPLSYEISSITPLDFLCCLVNSGISNFSELVVIDHTPENIIRSFDIFSKLGKSFKVSFVHIVRDGRAVYNSLLSCDWGPNSPQACADFWVRHVSQSSMLLAQFPNTMTKTVKYETIVSDFTDTIFETISHFSLTYKPNNHSYSAPARTS